MSDKSYPQILTANHLLSGHVIYMDQNKRWDSSLQNAHVFIDPGEASQALTWAETTQADTIIGAYLAPVKSTSGGLDVTHFREAFRAKGPSNYLHGKQEESSYVPV